MLPIILEAVCNVAYVGGICFATVLEFIDTRNSTDGAEGERSRVCHCCRCEAEVQRCLIKGCLPGGNLQSSALSSAGNSRLPMTYLSHVYIALFLRSTDNNVEIQKCRGMETQRRRYRLEAVRRKGIQRRLKKYALNYGFYTGKIKLSRRFGQQSYCQVLLPGSCPHKVPIQTVPEAIQANRINFKP